MLKAVIPVAGLGTRMLPATKAIPKEMLPIVDKPLIQYIVNECAAAGIKEIILVTHSSKNAIENHFDTSFELESMLETHIAIMKEACDNRYFKHIINIQLDVYRMGGKILLTDGLPYRGTFKLALYHLLGIKRLCSIHKLFRIITFNR